VIDKGIKAAGKSAEDAFDEFWQKESGRMAAMEEFRQALAKLTAPNKGEATPQKLIFIIDELDRCRPDYALTLLEIIKHFFAVPNVHFVLGTNLTELENSVKARYGADIKAAQYLQKFVSLVVQFPKKQNGTAGGATMVYLEKTIDRIVLPDGYRDEIRNLVTRVAFKHDVSLRDIQRLLTYAALLPASLSRKYGGVTTIIVGALFLRAVEPKLYAKLRSGDFRYADIEVALALQKPTDADTRQDKYGAGLDWVIWVQAINGNLKDHQDIPVDLIDFARGAFGRASAIQWETIEAQFATAFDTYTLPNQL
jgi:hypothetical protein